MLFCHLAGARSLREITGGLADSERKLRHLSTLRAPSRPALANANKHRTWMDLQGRLRAPGLRQVVHQVFITNNLKLAASTIAAI